MSPSGLIITRPQPEANTLSSRLSALGIPNWPIPTLKIQPIRPSQEALAGAHRADHWIFISANAVREGWPHLSPHLAAHTHLAAVGSATAQRLRAISSRSVTHPEDGADSEALLRLPLFQDIKGASIALVRGQGGRAWLRDALMERGAAVTYVECYMRQAPASLNPDYDEAVHSPSWISLQSAESLMNLWQLSTPTQREALRTRHFLVSHPNIAKALIPLGLTNFALLKPGDDALIQHLQEVWPTP